MAFLVISVTVGGVVMCSYIVDFPNAQFIKILPQKRNTNVSKSSHVGRSFFVLFCFNQWLKQFLSHDFTGFFFFF